MDRTQIILCLIKDPFNMTQDQVARLYGISQARVSQIISESEDTTHGL